MQNLIKLYIIPIMTYRHKATINISVHISHYKTFCNLLSRPYDGVADKRRHMNTRMLHVQRDRLHINQWSSVKYICIEYDWACRQSENIDVERFSGERIIFTFRIFLLVVVRHKYIGLNIFNTVTGCKR